MRTSLEPETDNLNIGGMQGEQGILNEGYTLLYGANCNQSATILLLLPTFLDSNIATISGSGHYFHRIVKFYLHFLSSVVACLDTILV